MRTRSVTRLFKIGSAWAVLLTSMLACSQGYVTSVELTATAEVRGVVNPTSAPTTYIPTNTAVAPSDPPAQPLVPTFTDLPLFTSTPAAYAHP